jgi:hypothetical protein
VCFVTGSKSSTVTATFCYLRVAFLEEAIIINIIIIIFINYNTAVINNLWRAPRPYFALHDPHWHAKGFFFLGGGA